MGFCPELARPLGAPTLILRAAGRRGRVSRVAAVRVPAANAAGGDGVGVSSAETLRPLAGHNCHLTRTAQVRTLNPSRTRM